MKKSLLLVSFLVFTYVNKGQTLDNLLNNSDLLNTATISVTIGGEFPVTGSFPAFISERVDQFVTRLFLEAWERTTRVTNDTRLIKKIEDRLKNYSLRGIKLIRSSGEEYIVDLMRFRITGDFKYNPYLKNDDVLIFPANDLTLNFFSVTGAVNSAGTFYYVEGDSLNDALELAMGVNNAYNVNDKVVISRLDYKGEYFTTDTVDINSNIKINRGDQIKVIAPDNLRKNYHVLVLGEVNIPGTYPITKNDTKLREIIEAAGGFTDQASLRRARLYSGNSLSLFLNSLYGYNLSEQPDLEDPRIRSLIINLETALMYRMSNVYPEDSSYFFLENQLRVLTEGSSLDFSKIDDPNSDISNYLLKSGDIIIIPEIQNSVYVFGQVAKPGYIPLVQGKDYNYYITEAGGIGDFAVEDEIMIIKGGSRNWISPRDQDIPIEEGDYIYVPKERLRTFRSYIVEYSVIVSMLSSLATVALVVYNILTK